MQAKTKSIILLVEMENGEVHQAVLSATQESAIKSVLQALPDNLQLLSTPLDLKIERQGDNEQRRD